MAERVTVRPVEAHEMPLVLAFIRELAEYEHLEDQVVASEADLSSALSGPRPYAEVVFGSLDGDVVGFALFFHNFSTFRGKPGIYLEDLYVRPAARGHGVGKQLLAWLARTALEWAVLDWNAPSIGFYHGLGAVALDDWTVMRMTGAPLERLAQG